MTPKLLGLAFAMLLVSSLRGFAPTGVIVGKVIEGAGSAPITGVVVSLSAPGVRQKNVLVDAQGRFLFTELPAGAFTIRASKSGYLDSSYGMLRPDGAGGVLELQDGERVTDAIVRLWRTSSISGVVVDDAGDPLMGATVQAMRRTISGGRWRLATTGKTGGSDERGVYRVSGLIPGDYALVISSFYQSAPLSLLSAADATRRMAGPEASALATEYTTNGVGGFINDFVQGFGVYRVGDQLLQLSGMQPPASADGRSLDLYPTVWHPSAATPSDAIVIPLGAGEQRTGIDLHPTLTRAVRVSGTVIGPNGPVGHLAMRLTPSRMDDVASVLTSSLSMSFNTTITASDATGTFSFLAPPGQYTIRVMTTPPRKPDPPLPPGSAPLVPAPAPLVSTTPTLWVAMPVSIDSAGVADLAVVLRRGIRVTGRAEFEGAATKPTPNELRAIRLSMDPADGQTVDAASTYQAQIDPAGQFYTPGLVAGRYVLRVDTAPRGWTLKSAVIRNQDITDVPLLLESDDIDGLVVTFTDRPASLSGSVRNAQGRPDADASVLVFPSDGVWTNRGSSPRRMRSVRASRAGTFTFSGMPSGDYLVIAVSDALASNWQEPAFLQRLARLATRVSIAEGQAVTAALLTATGIQR